IHHPAHIQNDLASRLAERCNSLLGQGRRSTVQFTADFNDSDLLDHFNIDVHFIPRYGAACGDYPLSPAASQLVAGAIRTWTLTPSFVFGSLTVKASASKLS